MTDAELRDLAVTELEATTISYPTWQDRVANGYKGKPYDGSKTAWGRAFSYLDQIGSVVEPEPQPGLIWPRPALSDPVRWTMTNANRQSTSLLSGSGRDLEVTSSEKLGPIQQVNAWRHFVWVGGHIEDLTDGNNYALPSSCTGTTHLEGMLIRCYGDALMTRGGSSEAIYQVQNSRIEVHFLGEPLEHSDCFQTQGGTKLKELRFGNCTLVTDYQGLFLRPPTADSFITGGVLRRVNFRQRVPGQDPAQAYLFIADEDPATGHSTPGTGPIVCEDVWMEVSDVDRHSFIYPDLKFSDAFTGGGLYVNRRGVFLEHDAIGPYLRPSTPQDVVPGNGPASGQSCLPAGWLGKIRLGVPPSGNFA